MIVLLTDFGLCDPFVGIMKGVIGTAAPVVDLTHDVPPYGVREAAWLLRSSVPYFPKGSIFVSVVDPGVGSGRRALLAETERHLFLAPDNGLLGWLRGARFREVTNRRLFLKPVSNTFHGRDVFASVASRLARGLPPSKVGPVVRSIVRLPDAPGRIVWIDRFGNLITNLAPGPTRVRFRGRAIPVVKTYGSSKRGSVVAVVGSSGTLEIAVVHGSAAAGLRARIGERVR